MNALKILAATKLLPLLLLLALPAVVQAQFTYTTSNGAITITGYTGPGGAVVIPATINGYPVISIGENAFEDSTLTSVNIPNSVTSIGDYAFTFCESLTSVTIPNSVASIGNGAFESDENLTSVTIPNSVASIGDYAFDGCGLTNVTIPNSVTSIGDSAFANGYDLTNIAVAASNPDYSSLGGVLFDKSQVTLLQFPRGLGGSYTISNGVTTIGDNAFQECTSLTSVAIPNSVTSIGGSAFYLCVGLTNITVAASNPAYSSLNGVLFDKAQDILIQYPIGLRNTTYIIPNSVTSIGLGAFEDSRLKNVTFPSNVVSIGDYAFAFCTSLAGVYFQGNAPSTDATVFENDTNAKVYYLSGTTGWNAFNINSGIGPAVLWNPQANNDASFGIQSNQFGFNITGSSNIVVVVEACANLTNPVWQPISTNTLNNYVGTNGTSYFSDPHWTNYSNRYYGFGFPQ